MKRLILCADNRTPYTDEDVFYKHCIQNTQNYARSKGFDFRFDLLTVMVEGRHWSWQKIKSILKFVEDYDEILWMDSDATIINHDVDVFDTIRHGPNLACWKRDSQIDPILYFLTDFTEGYLCAGIFLIDCKNKGKTKRVLEDWWNDIPHDKFKMTHDWEQRVINTVWMNDPIKQNYVKGIDIWSFYRESLESVFLHITSGLYNYHAQLHESKVSLVKRSNSIGILVHRSNEFVSDEFQRCLFLKQRLETQGYIVWFLIENDFYGFIQLCRNKVSGVVLLSINEKLFKHCIRTVIYGTSLPSKALEQSFQKWNVTTKHIDDIKENIWSPAFVTRVKSMYSSTVDTLDILIHAKDNNGIRMAVLYASILQKARVHIYGDFEQSIVSGFDVHFTKKNFEDSVIELEQKGNRVIVLSYNIQGFDYRLCEAMYRGIPIAHNSTLDAGFHYSSPDDLQRAVKIFMNMTSYEALYDKYNTYLKSVDPSKYINILV